jgi:hypothetical protein
MMKMDQRMRERNDWREGREMTTDGGNNRGEGELDAAFTSQL